MSEKTTAGGPDYVIHTDGGCAANPGGPGGIGVVIVETATGRRTEISKGYVSTTNNRMEVMAAIEALGRAPKGASIVLWSDSTYMLNCAAGRWKRTKNADLWRRFDEAASGKKIEFRWTRGHAGDPENERCDALASAGIAAGDKEVDEGYDGPGSAKTAPADGRAHASASTPASRPADGGPDRPLPEGGASGAAPSWEELVEERGLKEPCAKALAAFLSSGDRSFAAYARLKTGGIDAWSRKRPEEIAKERPELAERFEETRARFDDEKDFASAARWVGRGLGVDDAVRKAETDAEIRKNCR